MIGDYCLYTKKEGKPLFIPSLMLGPFEQLSMLVLTHLLFAPLGDVTHTYLLLLMTYLQLRR